MGNAWRAIFMERGLAVRICLSREESTEGQTHKTLRGAKV